MKSNIEELVLGALERNAKAREDDFILYGSVLKDMGIDIKKSLAEIFSNHIKLGLPAFESVSRARRKIAETRPDLFDAQIRETRANEQERYEYKYGRFN